MLPATLLVWIGDGTTPDEHQQLAALGVPGLWIGRRTDGIQGWAHLETALFDDRVRFTRQFVDAVASVVEVPEAAYVSNSLSNELRRTGTDYGGRAPAETPADLHRHGRRRTRTDPRGPQTAGS